MYVSHPMGPLSPEHVGSATVVSLSLCYMKSVKQQNYLFHTFSTYLQSILGWLCDSCCTVGFLLLFPVYSSRVLLYRPSYSCYSWFSAPLLQEILWFSLEKTEFTRGCLQKDHVPRIPNKSPVCLRLSFSLLFVFLYSLKVLSMIENDHVT